MRKKRWKVAPADKSLQARLAGKLEILPVTAQLLINRGLVDCDTAFSFMRPELKDLHDPFLMKDMERAVDRIALALGSGEKIAVYGDYDVDGTTSAALLCLFFRDIGVEAGHYIPDRKKEGYGLNAGALKELKACGVRVVVTVDCGATNHDEIRFAGELGMDVIVTDHHELSMGRPPALAVLNPKQAGCAYPFKGLAGVGVAFKLVTALRAHLRRLGWFSGGPGRAEPNLKRYLDLVAIGTVADMVPLIGENRVFTAYGLKEIDSDGREGLRALKEVMGLRGKARAYNIAFQMAPRINAAGRLAHAGTSLRLLTTADPVEARSIAAALDAENSSRQRLEEEILSEAVEMSAGFATERGIVLSSEGWHPGVIGIVASRLVDRFGKPAVLIALEGSTGKGSARGIRPVSILDALKHASPLLERFGGHRAAAGLTIHRDKVGAFSETLLNYLRDALTDDDLVPEVSLDAVVSLGDVDRRLVSEIERLEPFGCGNGEPLLCLEGARILATEVVGSKHLRFRVSQDGCSIKGIGFNLAGLHPVSGDGFSLAFSPYVDEWRGGADLRLRIKEVHRAQ